MQCHRNWRKDSNQREIRTQRSLRGEIEATSPSNLQRKQRQPLKGKTWELFILNAIILVVEGILSRSKPDSERQDTGAVKCVNRTVYAVFVDSEKAFWNHYIKFLCFSLSRQRLEERHKREKKGHDLNYKTPGLLSYPILTDINISIRRHSTSAQKLSKLTCRSIFKRNRSNIWRDQQVTTSSWVKKPSSRYIDHDLQHQHRQCPSVWIELLENVLYLLQWSKTNIELIESSKFLLFIIYIGWLRYNW